MKEARMRFGTFVPQAWKMDLAGIPVEEQWDRITATAATVESAGYDSLWVYHFHTHPVVSQESTFEAWTLMAALAVATSRVRLGQMCTCVPYRPPSLLAKMAVSVDAMAGDAWTSASGQAGLRESSAATATSSLRRGCDSTCWRRRPRSWGATWTQDLARFEGEHYRLEGAITRPRSIQHPYPPLWIAGGGERRTLRIAARYGDFTNFGRDLASFRHKSEVLAEHCQAVGRPFGEIGRSTHMMSVIGRDDRDLARKLEVAARRRDCEPEEFAERHLAGTVGEITQLMGEYWEAGCSDMILYFYDMGVYDSLELFAAEVIPQVKG